MLLMIKFIETMLIVIQFYILKYLFKRKIDERITKLNFKVNIKLLKFRSKGLNVM